MDKISEAICYAAEKHQHQKRKGTDYPYIVHPLAVMDILRTMNADTNLMVAGLLHDVLEDTNTTYREIEKKFGEDVARLVLAHTDDKSLKWVERKKASLEYVKSADIRIQRLFLADKLANIRDIKKCLVDGMDVWKLFKEPKHLQEAYYRSSVKALCDTDYGDSKLCYEEFASTVCDVF